MQEGAAPLQPPETVYYVCKDLDWKGTEIMKDTFS